MSNENAALQNSLAKLIKAKTEFYDNEMTDGSGWHYLPLKSFLVELCAILQQNDKSFDEAAFLAQCG